MDESEYNKIKKKVGYALTKYKATNYDLEDITQEVVLMWAERGFKTGQLVDHAVIDVLRKYTGRKGSVSYSKRTKLENASGFDDGLKYKEPFRPYVGERGNFGDHKRFLGGTDRACFVLSVTWGLNGDEIADCFGVTGGRICQRLKRIQGCISARVKAEKSRVERAREEKVARILPEENEGIGWRLESFEDQGLAVGQSW